MKISNAVAFPLLATVTLLAIWVAWQVTHRPLEKEFISAERLMTALQAYAHDHQTQGQRLPGSVSLEDLINGHYLSTNEIKAFEGMKVVFSTAADDSDPRRALIRIQTSDGRELRLLPDGRVEQF